MTLEERAEGRRLRALYAAVGGGIGTLLPYLVLYLVDRGLSPAGAGLVVGLMSAVGVLVIPVWGRLADASFGVVRALRLSCALAAVASLALLAAGRLVPAIVVCALLLAAARAPGEALADTLTVGTVSGSADYGRVRLWASAGFAVTVGLWGLVLARTGLGLVLVAYPATLVVAALSTRRMAPVAAAGQPETRTDDRTLLDRRVLVLLGGTLVFGVAMATTFTVLPLRIVDVGGPLVVVGASAVVGAAAEIPLMHRSAWLSDRLGGRRTVLLGGALFAVAVLVYGTVPAYGWLVAASAVRGSGYALVYVGLVTNVRASVPHRLQARGQALLQTVLMGLAPVVGASLGGVAYGRVSPALLFGATAVVALVGTVVASSAAGSGPRVPRRSEPAPEPPQAIRAPGSP